MHKPLLLVLLFCSLPGTAQKAVLPNAVEQSDHFLLSPMQQATPPKSVVPEIIEPVTLATEACADTSATVYSFTAEESVGYPFGSGTINNTNIYASIQRFVYSVGQPYQVNEVGVAFAVADSGAADQVLTVQIYNDLNADSTLGSLIATSEPILVSDIIVPDNGRFSYTPFTFSTPGIVERDSFWVYVDATDIYEGIEGDVAIISTTDSCGSGRNSFVVAGSSETNQFIGSVQDIYGLEVELYMTAEVDTNITVSNRRLPRVDYELSAFPNPVVDEVTLSFVPRTAGQYRATIMDLHGRTLRTEERTFSSFSEVSWRFSLHDLPAGSYVYRISGPAGSRSRMLHKQ